MTTIPNRFWAEHGNGTLNGARGGSAILNPCRKKNVCKCLRSTDSVHPIEDEDNKLCKNFPFNKERRGHLDDHAHCSLAKGFSINEKIYAQSSFLAMGVIGMIGIIQQDWIWVFPYIFVYWYGIFGIVVRHLACPRCPHLHVYGDCLQAPKTIVKRLIKKRKAGPFSRFETFLFYAIFILIPTYPIYWLSSNKPLLIAFLVSAVMWYSGQWLHFCRRCRIRECPFNRAGQLRSALNN